MNDQTPGRQLSQDGQKLPYSEDDLIEIIRQKSKDWKQARQGWITEAKQCRTMVAGGGVRDDGEKDAGQWDDKDKQALRDQQRPVVEFNRIGPVVDVVAGLEVTNRQEVRYIPRELGDAGLNEILTGAAQWTRDECNAEDEESEAFVDMAITGEGWTETRLDYEYDQDGMILTERVDGMEMIPDSASTKKNYRDADGLIREKMVDLQWAKDMWPDKADDIENQRLLEQDENFEGESVHRNVIGDQYQAPGGGIGGNFQSRQVKLTEYQFKKREPYFRIQDPRSGQIAEISQDKHDQIQVRAKQILGISLKSVKQTKCVYWRAFAIGTVLLECKPCPDPTAFTYKAMTAKRDTANKRWYGIVRGMLDPQRWANKFFSQSLDIMNSNAKGGVLAEEDAVSGVDGWQKFELSWSNPRAITKLASGGLGKVRQKDPPAFPPEIANLMQFAISSIRDVSGVSVELLGIANREQPAALEYQRKQAGVTVLATLFDALRKYRKEQGKSLLYLIQTYLSDGRLVRIVGQQGQKYVPLVRSEGAAKYDVIIDESPSSPNQKEKTWAVLQTILPMMVQAGVPIPPDIIDYLPLPQSLIDALKKPNPQRDQMQSMKDQLAIAGTQAKVSETQASAADKNASAQLKMKQIQSPEQGDGGEGQARAMAEVMNAGTNRMQAQHGMQLNEAQTISDIQSQRNENARKLMETLGNLQIKKDAATRPAA